MGGMIKTSAVLYVSLILALNKHSDCTTHPRVKMYGPKVTIVNRPKPEPKVEPDVVDEVKLISQQDDDFFDEPSCLELRLMWRISQRQSQLTQSANSIPVSIDPFSFNFWDDYVKPRFMNRQKSIMFERSMPDRFHFYGQLKPFEKIARLTTAARALMDDQFVRKPNLFRLGYPIAKIPIIAMRLTAKDRFQQLKDLMRHEKLKYFHVGENENETLPVIPVTTVTPNDIGKKRPSYETIMSRPRHFSQGHYMNIRPNNEVVDDHLTATVSPQYKSAPLVSAWSSRW